MGPRRRVHGQPAEGLLRRHATAENDYCFERLPRIDKDDSAYRTSADARRATSRATSSRARTPPSATRTRGHRLALAKLDWLVVRDLVEIETASFWHDARDRVGRAPHRGDRHRGLLPAGRRAHREGRLLHQHAAAAAVALAGGRAEGRLPLRALVLLPPRADHQAEARRLRGPARRAGQGAALGDPTHGELEEPSAEAVLAGDQRPGDRDGQAPRRLPGAEGGRHDACGCWIYSGVFEDGVNKAARRKPHWEQESYVAPEWAWAWPANRRILYNRASADPDGKPVVGAQALRLVGRRQRRWTGPTSPTSRTTRRPSYRPPEGRDGRGGDRGDHPFIMQADGRAWLFVPQGLEDGPLPTHYEPHESPFENRLYVAAREPAPPAVRAAGEPVQPRRRRARRRALPVRRDHVPADRAPHRGRHVAVGAVPRRAPAGDVLRGQSGARRPRRGSSTAAGRRSTRRARRSRRACSSPTASRRSRSKGRSGAPGRAALPLGRAWAHDRRRGQRPLAHRARPERPHPGGQGFTCGIRPGRRPRGAERRLAASPCSRTGRQADGRRSLRPPAPRRLAGHLRGRGEAAHGLLHRHLGLHRLQGVRGRVQGVEPRARGRLRWTGESYDNTSTLGANTWRHVAFVEQRRSRCASTARAGADGDALADELRRLQALHARRLPRRLPDRLALPHRVRHGRRPGGHLQRLRLLRPRVPVRRARPAAPAAALGRAAASTAALGEARTAASGSARSATTG